MNNKQEEVKNKINELIHKIWGKDCYSMGLGYSLHAGICVQIFRKQLYGGKLVETFHVKDVKELISLLEDMLTEKEYEAYLKYVGE